MNKMKSENIFPTVEQLNHELRRERYKERYKKTLWSTIYILIVVAAIAVLISSIICPVMQITGESMTPTLNENEIVVLVKVKTLRPGDLVGFSWNNKTLIKRVIATPGDWVVIDKDGTVFVNEVALQENYVEERSLGECDLTFPFQVPESCYFVLGDHRATSVDSRSSVIGSVNENQIFGKGWFRVFPLNNIGFVQ